MTSLARSSSWRSSKSSWEMRPCEVLVEGRELLEELSLVDLIGFRRCFRLLGGGGLVLAPRLAVVHLRLGSVLLGLVALQFAER